jgi:hypothetical protein
MSEAADDSKRKTLEAKWERNESELRRLYSLSPLFQEVSVARIDQLEAEQDEIKWEIGAKGFPPGTVRWSGKP